MELIIHYKESLNQKKYWSNFIILDKGDIEHEIIGGHDKYIEIVVGNKEDFRELEIINLNDAFGNLNFDVKRARIIKVPKELDDNYYNFSIIQNTINSGFNFYYIEICYDKVEFIPVNYKDQLIKEYSNFISFSVNPYSYIPNNSKKSDEKYFYIFIHSLASLGENLLL